MNHALDPTAATYGDDIGGTGLPSTGIDLILLMGVALFLCGTGLLLRWARQ